MQQKWREVLTQHLSGLAPLVRGLMRMTPPDLPITTGADLLAGFPSEGRAGTDLATLRLRVAVLLASALLTARKSTVSRRSTSSASV